MKRINKAVNCGCRATPDFFLVAERMRRGLARESYIIQEYLEGKALSEVENCLPLNAALRAGMREAMSELHKHDLCHSDIATSNWLLTPGGLKAIDLSWNGTIWAGKAQDTLRMKNRYQVELPVRSIKDKLALLYITAKHRLRDSLHNFRKPHNKKNSSA
jgi:serine/threonine protein kinase